MIERPFSIIFLFFPFFFFFFWEKGVVGEDQDGDEDDI